MQDIIIAARLVFSNEAIFLLSNKLNRYNVRIKVTNEHLALNKHGRDSP